MKNFKKTAIFTVITLLLFSLLSVNAFASAQADDSIESGAEQSDTAQSGKLDMDLMPESFGERLEYAIQGTATGMLMVFGVLTLLTLILYGSKYIFYDLPNKKNNSEKEKPAREKPVKVKAEPAPKRTEPVSAPAAAVSSENDGELAAIITAAIAAMIESGEYKNEFVGGFRVVSFKRSTNTAWNRK